MKLRFALILFVLVILSGCFADTRRQYSVVFMDGNTYLETKVVYENEAVIPPTAPKKDGYIFIGWDKDLSKITDNIMVFAIYEKIEPEKYDVKFLVDGVVVKMETVEDGKGATSPTEPTKEGYKFIGWDKDFSNVTNNLEVNALFEKEEVKKYEVKFLVDGVVVKMETVEEGKNATSFTPSKEGYTFKNWDKDFTNVRSNLEVNAVFEINKYLVKFIVDGKIVKEEIVEYGKSASAPIDPIKTGYTFMGWDKSFSSINGNIDVNAIFQQIVIPDRIKYVSYVDSFTYQVINPIRDFINTVDLSNSLKQTITSVKYGGYRDTNTIVVYDASNLRTRNNYGFEIAVNSDGIAISKETLVDLPNGGFIISAHGTGIDVINKINIGDIVKYNKSSLDIKVYYDSQKSSIIGLYYSINEIINRVEEANAKYLALDYKTIESKINQVIVLYNGLLSNFNANNLNKAQELMLDVEFLLVEVNSMQIKGFWHYPLRSNDYYRERNKAEVIEFLTEVKRLGFNWIYLNTNFNGKSIYKSKYLSQSLTSNYTYEGYKDYLECFIAEAHKLGIKVSAWTNTLIIGDGAYNNSYKADWYQKGYNGENNYGGMYFIDISNPEARTHLQNLFSELASYDLDGIEFDFIRYPSGNLRGKGDEILTSGTSILDWGYTDNFINLFKESNPFTGDLRTLILTDVSLRKKWLDFKENLLTQTVKMLVDTIRGVNSDIVISAAVMSSITAAKNTYLQNWELWVKNGFIDMLEPMIYSSNSTYVLSQLEAMKGVIGNLAEITVGIFPETDGALPSMNAIQIGSVTEKYLNGFSKFSSKVLFTDSKLMNSFTQMNRVYTTTFTDSKFKIFNSYVYDLLDKVENYYSYANSSFNYSNLINVLEESYQLKDETKIDEYLNKILTEINKITNTTIKNRLVSKHNQMSLYLGK